MDLSIPDHPAIALLPVAPTEAQIEAFGLLLQTHEEDGNGADLGTVSHVNEGVYGRSITIAKDTFLVGLPHKRAGLAICVGDITVWTAEGRQRLADRGCLCLNSRPLGLCGGSDSFQEPDRSL